MKKHNFSAGPSILSRFTCEETAKAVLDLDGIGLSVMEVSHRDAEFMKILADTKQLFKEILNIPDDYSVLFLGGGASLQFCMIPYNYLNKKAGYVDTGVWSSKAIKEAKIFGEVAVLASSKESNYTYIPKDYAIPTDIDYLHITTNNTIYGTELHKDLDVKMPLIADTSSDMFSRPMDVSKYAMIYGGAQKNLGPAGLAYVIIKNDLIQKTADRKIPSMLDYRIHIENDSMYNTPPCVNIFASLQTLKYYKSLGGLEKIYKMNKDKAAVLYSEIDRNKLFDCPVKSVEDRSIMNVCFVMKAEYKEKEKDFLDFAKSKGMSGLKGHRSVGGFRASIYNAMPIDSVKALVDCMQEFEKKC